MPNRMLYASLLGSRKVNQLKPAEFELYIRLLLVADDYGRYSGIPARVARSCWPDREDVTSKQVEPLMKQLATIGLVVLYEDDADKYLQVTGWNQRTRADKSKYPPPPDICPTNDGQMTVTRPSYAHVDVDVDVDVDGKACAPIVKKYGSENNVKLTDDEMDRFRREHPDLIDEAIELLSLWLVDKGDKSRAKTHNATIRRWVLDAVREKRAKQRPAKQSEAERIMSL